VILGFVTIEASMTSHLDRQSSRQSLNIGTLFLKSEEHSKLACVTTKAAFGLKAKIKFAYVS
jgi:hypothetical protein